MIGATNAANPLAVICRTSPSALDRLLKLPSCTTKVPRSGFWREIANTDSNFYGGNDVGNEGGVHTVEVPAHGEPRSLEVKLPPLATLMLRAED